MPPCVAFCLLVIVGFAPSSACGQANAHPLTTAQSVRELSPAEARTARPVKITGVVTHANPHLNDFWFQDATAGIYVHPASKTTGLTLGDQVEVEGVSDEGAFSPCITPTSIKKLGKGKLPEGLPSNLLPEEARWLDGQFVRTLAVVRSVSANRGITRLEVYTAQGSGAVLIPGEELARKAIALKDAVVYVRGVCVGTFKNRAIFGLPKVYMTALPEVLLIASDSPDSADAPPRIIDHLLHFVPAPHPGTRQVKIAGIVTAAPLRGVLVVQDSSSGATLWLDNPTQSVPLGTQVEARGLLRIDGMRIGLTRVTLKTLGVVPPPEPVEAMPNEVVSGRRDATVVKISGYVAGHRAVAGWTAVTLTDGSFRFEAFVPGLPASLNPTLLEIGAQIQVVGVPLDATPDGKAGAGLFLRGAESLTLLDSPPRVPISGPVTWWTTQRVAYLIVGFLAVALVGGMWVWTLRVQVRRAAGEIQKQYEEKSRLEKQLRQAAKLEAVGRLAGGIAHDFNNLLTVINGCAEMISEETARRGGRLHELAADIRRAGDRAADLTGQLLTFSRKREIVVSAVHLNDVVTDTVRLLERVLGEHIRINATLAPELPTVQGDSGMLHQVIMNLAVNARDAMPAGGSLALTTALIVEPPASPPGPHVCLALARQFVRLTVSDGGLGMSDEVKARIFEPFFTTKDIGEGTGLGLATVYGIVQTLHGKIRVESAPGRGTTFQIDLRIHGEPISDSAMIAPPLTPLPDVLVLPAACRLAGATILVVEDNEMVREVLVAGLTNDGATVLTASRPDHALRLLADHHGRVDVLVTDVVMPGMSGRLLADQVRAQWPTVRVMFMSGYTADEVLRQGVLEDQVEFLQKPFTPDHLTMRLLRVLGRL